MPAYRADQVDGALALAFGAFVGSLQPLPGTEISKKCTRQKIKKFKIERTSK